MQVLSVFLCFVLVLLINIAETLKRDGECRVYLRIQGWGWSARICGMMVKSRSLGGQIGLTTYQLCDLGFRVWHCTMGPL